MFTSFDKALVALVMAIIYMGNTFLDLNIGVSEQTINNVVAVFTPLLVWLVPNKAKTDA